MSFRQGARDGAAFSAAWLLGIALLAVAVVAYLAIWGLAAPWVTEKKREINHNSQQYQDSQIREARNLLDGIIRSGNKDQKDLLISRFCSTYDNIDSPPDDLVVGSGKFC